MASEPSTTRDFANDSSAKTTTQSISKNHFKYALKLDYNCVNSQLIKNIQADVWKYSREIEQAIPMNSFFFFGIENNDKSFKKLALAIQSTKKIHKFLLDSTMGKKTSCVDIRILNEALKRINPLRSLHLRFWTCHITVRNLLDLSKGFQRLKSLRTLDLNLGHCNDLNPQALESLGLSLKRFPELKDLSLDFTWCEWFDDKCLKTIGKDLERVTSLQRINLVFFSCLKITDAGLSELGERLKKLVKSLISLSLNFGNCRQITSQGSKNLSDWLYRLSNLEKFHLCFTM